MRPVDGRHVAEQVTLVDHSVGLRGTVSDAVHPHHQPCRVQADGYQLGVRTAFIAIFLVFLCLESLEGLSRCLPSCSAEGSGRCLEGSGYRTAGTSGIISGVKVIRVVTALSCLKMVDYRGVGRPG